MSKKIIHVCESFGGGIMDFVHYLVTHMPHHEHIVIYAERTDLVSLNFSEAKLIPWKYAKRRISLLWDTLSILYLFSILRKNKADVIHLHSSKAGFAGRLLSPFLKSRILFTANGASFTRQDVSGITHKLFVFLERMANRMGGQVVSVSKSEMKAFHEIGVNSIYVNNGISIPEKYFKSASNPLTVITVGRITHQKNPKMFNQLAEKFIDDSQIKFVWVGDGELRHVLTSKNIEITGWLNKQEVLQHMKMADIYMSTALWEGLPFAVLEAMSYSLPLVLYDGVGNKDLVRNNENGYLFDDTEGGYNALKSLKDNKEIITELGNKSFELLKQEFSVDQMIDKYDELYSVSDEEFRLIINNFKM